MKITEIRDTVVPIQSEIRNAYIDFGLMTVSVVALITDVFREGKPVVGFGFNSNGRYAQKGLLRERFLPRLEAAAPDSLINEEGDNLDPEKIWRCLMKNEKPGGHGDRSVAVGVIDMAVWDAVAKIAGLPLYRYLADRYRGGETEERVSVYAAGGYYYPGKDLGALKDEMRSYLDRGYTTVKMKIGGASLDEDLGRIEAVLSVVGEGQNLAVDANGKFDLETAAAYGDAMAPYGLRWYEEAGDPLDYALQAELSKRYEGPMATGENLFSHQDARNLIRHGGLRPDRDILQFDCALSYGLVEYLRTLEMLEASGWSRRSCVPHGGHQMCLNIAAGLGLGGNESYPDVFKPFNGFADDVAVEGGYVGFPDIPGIGLEAKNEPYGIMKELAGI
ncbi:MAG: mandelate racemase/muconate lactonizing enzyme family protein [Nitrospinota bacterium]|nr:mandelate racemase [Nitrospinota bacterium]MDP6366310.1 mandelate racemase/muconate lactonizing enzyme family protein [Nitrospinota bacterium]